MSSNKWLIVRPDRLGDTLLSTPAMEFASHILSTPVDVGAQAWVGDVLKGLPFVRDVVEIPSQFQWSSWFQFVAKIRSRRYKGVVLLQCNRFFLALAFLIAGIPVRVGVLSKVWSYFLYNKGLRQKRSKSIKNEAQYGLELVSHAFSVSINENIKPKVQLSELGKKVFNEKKFLDQNLIHSGYFVVHPGMGGSAQNWPQSKYAELVKTLSEKGLSVVVSGGSAEKDLVDLVAGSSKNTFKYVANPGDPVSALGCLFQNAKCVLAPSTGPLHLAAALGVPVVGIYPLVRVQSPLRWGPYLAENAKILTPSQINDAVSDISVEVVLNAILSRF